MAGFSRLYCIGGVGGFDGSDGANPISCQFWVGDADRQWWQVHYIDQSIAPLGQVSILTPAAPNHPDALIDCCMAFLPDLFVDCASMAEVRRDAAGLSRLDFDLGAAEIPAGWARLRDEARPTFADLAIFEAELRRIEA